MKAVVVELRGRRAAILGHDGIVRILPDRNYRIGQILEIPSSMDGPGSARIVRFCTCLKHHAAAAAVFALITLGVGGSAAAAWYPASSVTLELDDALEYQLNIFDRVLSVKAKNEEGNGNVREIEKEVKGQKIGDAVAYTLDYYVEEKDLSAENVSVDVRAAGLPGHAVYLEESLGARIDSWNSLRSETGLPDGSQAAGESAPAADVPIPGKQPGSPENFLSDSSLSAYETQNAQDAGMAAPVNENDGSRPSGEESMAQPSFPGEGSGSIPESDSEAEKSASADILHASEAAGASQTPEAAGASQTPEAAGASQTPDTAGASQSSKAAGASQAPEAAGASQLSEAAGASQTPETAGASQLSKAAGASQAPEAGGTLQAPDSASPDSGNIQGPADQSNMFSPVNLDFPHKNAER